MAAAGVFIGFSRIEHLPFYPIIIDPSYQGFTTLATRVALQYHRDVQGSAGIEVDKVLVADASRRTPPVNAYFGRHGGEPSVLLFSTNLLAARLLKEEILAVIATRNGPTLPYL